MDGEIKWIKNPIYAMMINDWCCETMGSMEWNKEKIMKMLTESGSEKEFKKKFTEWVENEKKV